MAVIQEMLSDKYNTLNCDALIQQHPWILSRGMNCILSPDSDGLLCGLFMAKYFDWNIVGFYDGKVLLLKDGVSTYDDKSVFLDMEIFRKHIKSIGHHMVLFSNRHVPEKWDNYANCIQPNNLRQYDGKNLFRLKYPFATIHLLMAIVGSQKDLIIPQSAIAPLFFTDGTFNVLYSYPENVLNWLDYLGIKNPHSPLRQLFMHEHYTVYTQIQAMDEFFRKRDVLSVPGERGDKFIISSSGSMIKNVEPQKNGKLRITQTALDKVLGFINLLAQTTQWEFHREQWCFENLRGYRFTKDSFESKGWTTSIRDYNKFMELNPLSWAMTSNANIEFTLESPDTLP